MSYIFNDKIKNLTPYEPIKGSYRIRLDANESFLSPPAPLMAEIEREIRKTDLFRYPDSLAEKLCAAFGRAYGVNPALITAGNGSDELISVILSAFLMKGERMVTLEPDFSMYPFYGELAECACEVISKNEDLTADADKIIETVNRTESALLIFSNPCNPTSLGMTREEVRRIISGVKALVVLDEAYMDFWDQSLLPDIQEYDNLIILRTCSKALGLASVRIGFAIANKALTAKLRAVKSPYNVNSISQAVASVILNHPEYRQEAIASIKASRDMLYGAAKALEEAFLDRILVYPTVTNFIFLKCKEAKAIFDELKMQGIIVRQMGDYLRITAGTLYENNEALGAIRKYLEESA